MPIIWELIVVSHILPVLSNEIVLSSDMFSGSSNLSTIGIRINVPEAESNLEIPRTPTTSRLPFVSNCISYIRVCFKAESVSGV